MQLLPALNSLIYGYTTAMPRGFFNQAKYVTSQAGSPNPKTQELVEIFEPIMADRIKAAESLMGEANKLSTILTTAAPVCTDLSLAGYAPWENDSYNIAKERLFMDDASRLMYLMGYDCGSFFGNLSFLIVVLDFCLEGDVDNFALAQQFMLEQEKLYDRLKSYSTTLWMMPQPPIYVVEDVFFKGGMEPAYASLLQMRPNSRAEWQPVFEQLKAASMSLDQKFGELIKALM